MSQPVIRRAELPDIDQLVAMRRDFTFEGEEGLERSEYEDECRSFLAAAIECGHWQIWVAAIDGRIVSHVYLALVDKVPRPIREHRRISYLTNVYTRPEFRGSGIGSRLLERAQEAAREADVELMLVWPSEDSTDFYRQHGFASSGEPLVWEA
jgi:N-acetylglutamate synthase-like GNAT family acetyltransferase